jgi:hypothetical protein
MENIIQQIDEMILAKKEAEIKTNKTRIDAVHGNIFGDILGQHIEETVKPQDLRSVNYGLSSYYKGLFEARKNLLSSANLTFQGIDKMRVNLDKDSIIKDILDSAALPAKAYLHYKQHNYDEAQKMLLNMIETDQRLIEQSDFYILEFHRIQQIHNLARLEFRRNNMNEGAGLIGQGLRYMLNYETPQIGEKWFPENISRAPFQLRSDMTMQFAMEAIGIFLNFPQIETHLHIQAFSNLTFFEPNTEDEKLLIDYLEVKNEFIGDNHAEFINQALIFIKRASVAFDICKLSLINNIAEVLNPSSILDSELKNRFELLIKELNVSPLLKQICLKNIN